MTATQAAPTTAQQPKPTTSSKPAAPPGKTKHADATSAKAPTARRNAAGHRVAVGTATATATATAATLPDAP